MSPAAPEFLERWTKPKHYAGESWPGYYVGFSQHRDSDALTRSNFRTFLDLLKKAHPEGYNETFMVVRESHFLVGWVEWIAIHESDAAALAAGDEAARRRDDYPVLNEEDFSQEEDQEAQETWKLCYRPPERLEWIRKHRSQCEFHSFSDLLGAVRGKWFPGYASEMCHP